MPSRTVPAPQSIFEKSRPGRIGANVPHCDTPEVDLDAALGGRRESLNLPEIGELDAIRHFSNLSQVNSGIQPLQNLSVLLHVSSLGADAQVWARHFVLNGLLALEQRARSTRGAFLVGDQPTLADVYLVPQMFNARLLGVPLDDLSSLVEIDARCQALPRWSDAHPSAQPDAPGS